MSLGSKLNLKPGMTVTVLDTPQALSLDLGGEITVTTDSPADVVILFVADKAALIKNQATLVEAVANDQVGWVAYPKGGRLGTDLNRDSLRDLLGRTGIRPVRQVSIDDTWSALRFRSA